MGSIKSQDPRTIKVKYPLELLFKGGSRKEIIQRKNLGKEENVELDIQIKPGCLEGTKKIFTGKGDTKIGFLPQDIHFIIKAEPHETWTLRGIDLVTYINITANQALLGGKFEKIGMDGEPVTLELKTITPKQEYRISGKGMPKEGGGRGDAIFIFKVKSNLDIFEEFLSFLQISQTSFLILPWRDNFHGKIIGNGSYGIVDCITIPEFTEPVAKKTITFMKWNDLLEVNSLIREIQIMISCDHPNILPL